MRILGTGGVVRVGYQTAATLGDWVLVRTDAQPDVAYELTAKVVSQDSFWSQQRPMDLALTMAQRQWCWAGVQPAFTDQSLSVTLTSGPTIH